LIQSDRIRLSNGILQNSNYSGTVKRDGGRRERPQASKHAFTIATPGKQIGIPPSVAAGSAPNQPADTGQEKGRPKAAFHDVAQG
jgi:hypothetical protein